MPTADWATSNSAYGTPQPVSMVPSGASVASLDANARKSVSSLSDGWNGFIDGIGAGLNKMTGVEASNKAAAEEARIQREWETEMDNTKYQRAVEDMKKAGINPASLSGLSSSSVGSAPSGASASTHGPTGNIIGSLLSLVAVLALKKKA